MKLALCGNPNVGKTTLYNCLTRSDAPVGNWHGVTVDAITKRMGAHTLTDLPGAYSLTPRTEEERITVREILFGDYDLYIYVAEVNNLRRNLYMLAQLVEAGKRCMLVVNMMDEARGEVNFAELEKRLNMPVIGTSARERTKEKIISAAERAVKISPRLPDYTNDDRVKSLSNKIANVANKAGYTPAFAALKALEGDGEVLERLGVPITRDNVDYPARLRYKYIDGLLSGIVYKPTVPKRTVKLDKILLGKAALPIFLLVMAATFVITFEVARPLSNLIARAGEPFSDFVFNSSLPDWVISLLCDGFISGVGSVLSFLPQVVLLFLLTALLQDSGYMSRVAFAADGFFNKFGLSGRAAFSLVLGLGCSATAVLSTRGIAGERTRKRAAFAVPFCPCSARLAVFTAIASYMGLSGFVVAAMYVLSFIVMLGVLYAMKLFDRKREQGAPLIMEMPPYRLPNFKRVLSVVWHNVLSFVGRVGSVVLAVSVIFWALCNFSVRDGFCGGATSIMCTTAKLIAPLFTPLGFGNWKAVAALVSGIAAKETVISVIASLGGIAEVFGGSKLAAVSFTIFTALYVPCIATVSALAKESGIKQAALSVSVHTAAAYLASLVFYQSARLFQINAVAFAVECSAAVAAMLIIFVTLKLVRGKRKARSA
ncbi:MAG: ferrous iron transport protein B [Clostridiales bacterium]|nr:ferrous iron transport protein B [Clostridiales bacterium]